MSDASMISSERARGHVVRRLLVLTWRYRYRASLVLVYQLILLGMTLGVVALTGLSVDIIRASLDRAAPAPRWPFGTEFLASWEPLMLLLLIGALVLAMALIG